jgi:hypothetical protein
MFGRPICRYLAAKVFAAWCAYQGRGLRTIVRSLAAALAVLRMEAIRQTGTAARVLDEALWVEAVRAADLLLVHLASADVLARGWSRAEGSGPGWLGSGGAEDNRA